MSPNPADAKTRSTVFPKQPRPRRTTRTLLAIAGVGCAVAGVLSLRAIIDEAQQPGDPPQWVFLGLAIGSVVFALLAIGVRDRTWWALLSLLASVLSLVAFWWLAALAGGS